MNRQFVLVRRLDQGVAEELVIGVGGKYRLAVVAALDDVLRLAGNDETGKACHGCPASEWSGTIMGRQGGLAYMPKDRDRRSGLLITNLAGVN